MSGIAIKIEAGSTQETSSVHATGSLRHIITDEERATFGIVDEDLKRKIREIKGKLPCNVYVRRPKEGEYVPEDLHKENRWDQVETVLTPMETTILSVDAEPTIISRQVFKNAIKNNVTFTGKMSEPVSTTVETSWSQGHGLSFNQEISYDVKCMGAGIGGKRSLGFQAEFGKNSTASVATTIGTEAGFSAVLESGREVMAELSANSGKMKVRITYEARLTGVVALIHDLGATGIDSISISDVLGASNSVKVNEDIEIWYYDEAGITIKNLAG